MNKLLSDQEIDAISTAARPLPPAARGAFEQQCINALRQMPPADRGPGLVYRVISKAQKNFLRSSTSPLVIGRNTSRYDKPSVLRDKDE